MKTGLEPKQQGINSYAFNRFTEFCSIGENDKSENDSVLVGEDLLQVLNFSAPIRDPRMSLLHCVLLSTVDL